MADHEHRPEDGATATEYVFILAFIALIALAGIQFYGAALDGRLTDAATTAGDALE